jgi:hypothetical protein
VTWLGFDVQNLIDRAVDTLRRLANGKPCPDVTLDPIDPVRSCGSEATPVAFDVKSRLAVSEE